MHRRSAFWQSSGMMYKLFIEKNCVKFETDNMLVTLEKGVIANIFNRLTGTEYLVSHPSSVPEEFSNGLVYAVPKASQRDEKANIVGATPPPPKGSRVLVPTLVNLKEFDLTDVIQVGSHSIEYEYLSAQKDKSMTIGYSVDTTSQDLLISLRGKGKQKGLSGIRLGLASISCRGNLLVPALNGIKAVPGDSFYKFESPTWAWPSGWQVPLAIFNDALGGFWVHAQDTENRFKQFRYNYKGNGTWNVAFDTINNAPFSLHDSIESVTWRLNTYKGDWTIPADQYKHWAYKAYNIVEKERYRPNWMNSLQLIIKHADYISDKQITQFLDLLQKHVDPPRTLLFMTHWSDPTPIIPNWVASERGVRFNNEARKRGFRTMYFANYFGITPDHPKFDEFKPHFIRNPYTQEPEGWNLKEEWSEATKIQLYYVNPACKGWRDYQISQFKALFEKSFADGLFIDQTFVIFNDGNGLIEGQSTVDGNLAFHRELLEAIPDIAVGGEGINEITMQYESFCELHFLSLEMKKDQNGNLNWEINAAAFDRMVPLVSRIILPYTRPIGYLGFPDTRSSFYGGWRDALHIYKGISTLTRPTIDEIKGPDSEVRRVMKEAFPNKP